MAARLLLPVHDAPLLSDAEADLARDVISAGGAAMRAVTQDAQAWARMAEGSRFLYRRWVLEVLLILRAQGPLTYNEISRALGRIAGESLSPKLQDLERARIVERASTGSPPRVRYQLTEAGFPLACGAYAITALKREHVRALSGGRATNALGRVLPEALARAPPADPLASFQRAVVDFAQAHLARAPPDVATQLVVARRFSEACVRKWHGDVLSALAQAGPMRYSRLRDAIDVGDQALANTLADLRRLESVARDDGEWRVTPMGLVDVSVGGALILLLPAAERSTRAERLHAA